MASSSRSAPAPAAVVAAAVATTRDKPVPDPVPGLFADPPAIGEFASPYQLPLARTIYDPRVLALARCGGLHLASRRAPAGLAFSRRWLYAFAVAVGFMPLLLPLALCLCCCRWLYAFAVVVGCMPLLSPLAVCLSVHPCFRRSEDIMPRSVVLTVMLLPWEGR